MALSKPSLKKRIITELKGQGFVTEGEHARSEELATALANAIVDEITQNAEAIVSGGSSAGQWPVN
ncbi:hypothetical protein [Vibrio gazogenes]|uniref:Uncharacterized protein n=1 Tax=Vibrio gazogenes DSM 21264 = NBRC 103151 TaxID=1123492 RepID=A0A1M5C9F6_VIBGA|nr:hypothetical protein [Vibrio gazogenes]USP16283.1 hypothetical protein MKS89_18040 [Vibrio gazogenes]SHF51404.1 hypothetical protein SAMN02745781_02499 [Vibrio gazogenes DSM 21264] [Vibrio gazogenes DSM 21264 = NBRC 103151]SJN55389.1 hypothetical protein BQ6471_01530 [Vibrio gazogenes]